MGLDLVALAVSKFVFAEAERSLPELATDIEVLSNT